MAKTKPEEKTQKRNGKLITLGYKAKKVLQSNGLQYFLAWADKPTSGGRRKKADRPRLKTDLPQLYKELVTKGQELNRKMDRPKPKD